MKRAQFIVVGSAGMFVGVPLTRGYAAPEPYVGASDLDRARALIEQGYFARAAVVWQRLYDRYTTCFNANCSAGLTARHLIPYCQLFLGLCAWRLGRRDAAIEHWRLAQAKTMLPHQLACEGLHEVAVLSAQRAFPRVFQVMLERIDHVEHHPPGPIEDFHRIEDAALELALDGHYARAIRILEPIRYDKPAVYISGLCSFALGDQHRAAEKMLAIFSTTYAIPEGEPYDCVTFSAVDFLKTAL